jgi:hypothetical protein
MRIRFAPTVAAVLLVASSLACEGRATGLLATQPIGSVRVRLLNALTAAQSLSFVVDAQVQSAGVGFGSASPYVPLTPGPHRLQAQASTSGTTLLDFTRDLAVEGSFSLIPAPGLASFGALLIPDDLTVAPDQAKLRVIHLALAPGFVTVYLTTPTGELDFATPFITILEFAAASPYVRIPPGTYRVRVTPTGVPNRVIVDDRLTVSAGSVRTLLLTDAPSGGLPTTLWIVSDRN